MCDCVDGRAIYPPTMCPIKALERACDLSEGISSLSPARLQGTPVEVWMREVGSTGLGILTHTVKNGVVTSDYASVARQIAAKENGDD